MKNLKKYETFIYGDINVGDYILVKSDADMPHLINEKGYDNFIKFVSTNIGEVITTYIIDRVRVRYNKIPEEVKKFFQYDNTNKYYIHVDLNNIQYISTNKNDLKMVIKSNKYNL